MAVQFPGPYYKSAGARYSFDARIYDFRNEQTHLIPENTISFTCQDDLNELCLRADMIYNDETGVLDRFRDQQNVFIDVKHSKIVDEYDGEFKFEDVDGYVFAHRFQVETIETLKRDDFNRFLYKITMRSAYVINCRRHIEYSNYPNEEPVTDILKNCMNLAGFGDMIDTDSFESCGTVKTMKYMTNSFDNLETVFKYLYSKIFYGKFDDTETFPMLKFDRYQNKFFLVDFANIDTNLAQDFKDIIILSTDKSGLEQIQNGGRLVQVGSAPGISRTAQMQAISNIKTYGYDYSKNKLESDKIDANTFLKIYTGGEFGAAGKYGNMFTQKIQPLNEKDEQTDFVRNYIYCNNDMDLYKNFIQICKQDMLVFNTAGDIRRMPGGIVQIDMPETGNGGWSEDEKSNGEWKKRYAQMKGMWIIYSITDIICPADNSFTQNLTCFRNFMNNTAD